MKVDAGSSVKDLVIKIKVVGVNKLRFKIWLGSLLIRFGVFIIGCNFEIMGERND